MTIKYCNLKKKKSTYFGIIEKENYGATQARAGIQEELEEMVVGTRDNLVKILLKFVTYFRVCKCYSQVILKSSVHVVALSTNC